MKELAKETIAVTAEDNLYTFYCNNPSYDLSCALTAPGEGQTVIIIDSSNYFDTVEITGVTGTVEDKNIAWHCGAKKYVHPECRNGNSLGIELCVRNKGSQAADSKDWYFGDATVQNAIALTKELMAKYNVPADHVIRHYNVTGKICPNPFVYNHTMYTWAAFKAALTSRPTEYTPGWNQDKNGWWFADTKTTYYKLCWQVINGRKQYFNQDGYAVTNWQSIDGQWFYFEPRAGHNLECALYVSDQEGAQMIGEFQI